MGSHGRATTHHFISPNWKSTSQRPFPRGPFRRDRPRPTDAIVTSVPPRSPPLGLSRRDRPRLRVPSRSPHPLTRIITPFDSTRPHRTQPSSAPNFVCSPLHHLCLLDDFFETYDPLPQLPPTIMPTQKFIADPLSLVLFLKVGQCWLLERGVFVVARGRESRLWGRMEVALAAKKNGLELVQRGPILSRSVGVGGES